MAFKCDSCDFDLSIRMDLLALALRADYPDGDLPKELSVDGVCDNCGSTFNYDGEFFSHYMKIKTEDNVIGPLPDNYAVMAFDVSPKEHEEFKRLSKLGDKKQLSMFVRHLMLRPKKDNKS